MYGLRESRDSARHTADIILRDVLSAIVRSNRFSRNQLLHDDSLKAGTVSELESERLKLQRRMVAERPTYLLRIPTGCQLRTGENRGFKTRFLAERCPNGYLSSWRLSACLPACLSMSGDNGICYWPHNTKLSFPTEGKFTSDSERRPRGQGYSVFGKRWFVHQ